MNDRDVNVVNDVIFGWISVLPTMRYACALDLMFHVRKSYMIRFHLSFCTINLTPSVFCSFNSLFCFYLSAKEGQKTTHVQPWSFSTVCMHAFWPMYCIKFLFCWCFCFRRSSGQCQTTSNVTGLCGLEQISTANGSKWAMYRKKTR